MFNIIAKKYTQALVDSIQNPAELESTLQILKNISLAFRDKKTSDLLASPFLNKQQKEDLILSVLDKNNQKIQNLVKLLNSAGRLSLIPYIALELEKKMLALKKEYAATLVS